MLNINTRIVDSSDMILAKSAEIVAEGQALVNVPGEGLAPSTGAAGEVFAGFVMRRTSAAPIVESFATKVEEFVIEAVEEGNPSFEVTFEPVSGSMCVIDTATGAPVTVDVEGKVVSGESLKAGMVVRVVYRYQLTVVQARALFGDMQPGGAAGDQFGQTGVAKRGIIATNWFDTAVDWAHTKAIKLGAQGMLTGDAGSGTAIDGYVVACPSVETPFLVIEFSAA